MNKVLKSFLAVFAVVSLAACASNEPTQDEIEQASAEVLYANAAYKLDEGDEKAAAMLFDSVERMHPYSSWATKAELMKAYGAYKAGRYDESLDASERFIALHPGNEAVAYA